MSNHIRENSIFLSVIPIDTVVNKILSLDNRDLNTFRTGVMRVYQTNITGLGKYYGKDKIYLQSLKKTVLSKIEYKTDIGRVQSLNLKYICGDIDRICDAMEKS